MVVIAYGLLLPRALLDWPRLGLHQPARVAAAALARRGADPARRARGRCRDRHQRHADGRGPRHGARASRARDADRRARNGRRAPRSARRARGGGVARGVAGACWRGSLRRRRRSATRSRPLAPKIAKAEALLDWREPAVQLERRVRAFNPWPVAEARLSDGRRLRVFEADGRRRRAGRAAPGTIVAAGRAGIDVATGDGVLRLRANPAALGPRDGRRGVSRGAFARRERRLSPERAGRRGSARRRGAARRASARRARRGRRAAAGGRRRGARSAAARGARARRACVGTTGSNGRRGGCSTRPLERGQTALAALLRVGLLQLQELRIPEHAAVSATVDAAALLGARSAARSRQRRAAPLSARARAARAGGARGAGGAVRASALAHRRAARRPSARLAGDPRREQRARRRCGCASTCCARRAPTYLDEARGGRACRAPRRRTSSRPCALEQPVGVEALPGFAAGEVSVQDLSAQRAAALLDLAPGQRVLDACAAPGGKTGHILEAAGGRSEVWAVDRDAARARAACARTSTGSA